MNFENDYLNMTEQFMNSLMKLEDLYNENKISLKAYFEEKKRIINVFINYSDKEQHKVQNSLNNL